MKVTHVNYLKELRRKLQKKQAKFIAEHEFKSASELPFSREELTDAVELNRIISMQLDGRRQFPTFQFDADGRVCPVLQEHLPRLLGYDRGRWDICFWLFAEHAVTIKRALTNPASLRGISVIEMLELGKQAAEQTERYVGMPIDAAISGNNEVFSACVEHLLNPDYREIPEMDVDRESFVDDSNSRD